MSAASHRELADAARLRPPDGAAPAAEWGDAVATGGLDARGGERSGHLVVLSADPTGSLPDALATWLTGRFAREERYADADAVASDVLRARPVAVVLDARGAGAREAAAACRRLKGDAFTAIVPTVVVASADDRAAGDAFAYGADEVLTDATPAWEVAARMDALLRRSLRDTGVHPTTRLPGAPVIAAELTRRLRTGEPFAACYADLDHFKEFNDRYSYSEGDRVIRMVARLLHDVVRGVAGDDGFVGHIGGDDFLFTLPLAQVSPACELIVDTFELLVPLQYSDADRRSGYYFGKDRRGRLHRVPLMSLSIGVATTERRRYADAAQMSRMASEMKGYAKAQPGSLYAVDRRQDALDAPDPHEPTTDRPSEEE